MTDTIKQIVNDHADEVRARDAALEDDVQVVGHGPSGWAVLSKSGDFRFHDERPFDIECPCIIYSGLQTREAAEVARRDALAGLTDPTHRSPYGPSEVPLSYFEAVGRVVAKLREEGVQSEDLIGLAVGIAEAAQPSKPKTGDHTKLSQTQIRECPF